MLNWYFRQPAIYHGCVGFTSVSCSTMWFLSGELKKFKGQRQPNSLTGLVKPQRYFRECVPTHALYWVVSLGGWVRACFRPAHSYGCDDIPYISIDRTTMAVMSLMAPECSQISNLVWYVVGTFPMAPETSNSHTHHTTSTTHGTGSTEIALPPAAQIGPCLELTPRYSSGLSRGNIARIFWALTCWLFHVPTNIE